MIFLIKPINSAENWYMCNITMNKGKKNVCGFGTDRMSALIDASNSLTQYEQKNLVRL